MQWYEAEVESLEEKIKEQCLVRPVVFYGSSTLRLWSAIREDLGRDDILNLGFGGSTLEACDYFFDRLVVTAKPRSLVVYAGDNDLGDGRKVEQVVGLFSLLTEKLEKSLPGVPLGFISIKCSPSRFKIVDRIVATNTAIQDIISKNSNDYYINIFPLLLDEHGNPRPELFQADGLHLSPAGYRVWTKAILDHQNQIFADNLKVPANDVK